MTDLARAILIGVVFTAGLFTIPVVIAVLAPFLIFSGIVLAIWFLLQVFNHDDDDDTDKPP